MRISLRGYSVMETNLSDGCPEESLERGTSEPIIVIEKCPKKSAVPIVCPTKRSPGVWYLHKNVFNLDRTKSVFQVAFNSLRHPGSPVKSEFVYSQSTKWSSRKPYMNCTNVILTRTGSRESTPCKCVAVAIVPKEFVSSQLPEHRMGYSALLTNQFQNDYIRHINRFDEMTLLYPFLRDRLDLIKKLIDTLGDPLLPDGTRRTATIMVANEGVMDLILNFVCSVRASGIDLDGIIVFVGQEHLIPLINSMGLKAMYHVSLGSMPAHAAGGYADTTFTRLMWLKVTSVYLASAAGYDVLFQDADLVWMRDPRPKLQATVHDAVFMDDGARTPRFTPFFANTGFYYLRHNSRILHMLERLIRGVGEISYTHSHQATLNRHLTESQSLLNLKIHVLDGVDFPSGIMFHHNKTFMSLLSVHSVNPYVFHMCWTTNREEKVHYFKQIGMWFVPDNKPSCTEGKVMLRSVLEPGSEESADMDIDLLSRWGRNKKNSNKEKHVANVSISQRCCLLAPHWANKLDLDKIDNNMNVDKMDEN